MGVAGCWAVAVLLLATASHGADVLLNPAEPVTAETIQAAIDGASSGKPRAHCAVTIC